MKQLSTLLLGLLITLTTFAKDFEYTYEGQTLTYTVTDEVAKTCQTAWTLENKDIIKGELEIPATASDGEVEYIVTAIGTATFHLCESLTSVQIPGTITTIGSNAFAYCSNLASITIPNSVTKIEGLAFRDCTSLTSMTIPNSVTNVEYGIFIGCSSLSSIILGNSVNYFANGFVDCTGLHKSAYPETINNPFPYGISIAYNPDGSIIENGWVFGPEKSAIYFAPLQLSGDYAIPESVTTIGAKAFYDCEDMTSIKIPMSVTTINESAFSGCAGLNSIYYNTENPVETSYNIFNEGSYKTVTLYVPATALDQFKTVFPWNNFEKIETYNFDQIVQNEYGSIDETVADSTIDYAKPYEVYNMSGMLVGTDTEVLTTGIYILRQGTTVRKIAIRQ